MIRSLFGVLLLATVTACSTEGENAPPGGDDATAIASEDAITPVEAPACWLRGETTPEEAAERPSPRESAATEQGGAVLKVCWGAPSARGRTIIGGMDPYGEPWRMGANEATTFHTTAAVTVGGVAITPGTYSLFSIPDPESWTVVLNHQAERWGIPLDDQVRANDVGEFTVTTEATDEHIETMRYRFESQGEGRTDLLMEFETTRVRIPIGVTE